MGVAGREDELEELVQPAELLDHLAELPAIESVISRAIYTHRHHLTRKFILARWLFELLTVFPTTHSSVTYNKFATQQSNRAFAAELLAPAEEILNLIPSPSISSSETEELANHCEGSAMVITYQIQNHWIAEIEG